MNIVNILALDIGFASTGWVVFDPQTHSPLAGGTIKTSHLRRRIKKGIRVADVNMERAMLIARELNTLIREYDVGGIVAEIPSGGSKSATASRCMGMAAGVLAAVVELTGLPAEWATPEDVKRAVAGKPRASKAEMVRKAKSLFPDMEFPTTASDSEHVADAVGAYLSLKDGPLVRMAAAATATNSRRASRMATPA